MLATLLDKSKQKRSGFTLIELLIVIGIIAILAAIVIIAINPAKQLAESRNAQRWSNVNSVLNGIHQYAIDNDGDLPGTIATCPSTTDASTLAGDLVDTYLAAVPTDPQGGEYEVCQNANKRVTVSAPDAELSVTIEVQR